MAFAPIPPRNNAPAQLLSLSAILATAGGSGNSEPSAGVTITNPPTTGTAGAVLSLAGTVSPSGAAVQVGLSGSGTTAPTNWTAAAVNGTGWTASLTPSTAGIYYLWAQQTGDTSARAVSAAITISAAVSNSVAFSSPPTAGTVGTALSLSGAVSPSGSAVQVGLSTSTTVAPTSWTSATVSGTSWTASLTPSTAGTFYLWAEQADATSVQTVSGAVTISSGASGSALSYSLISGSGNGSLTGVTLASATSSDAVAAADWTSSIAAGATDVAPNIQTSAIGSIASCKFWFDTSATSTTVPAQYTTASGSGYGDSAAISNGEIAWYAWSAGDGANYCSPPAPATAGTYYGKYALYDSNSNLLGIFVTSAITVH